MQLLGYALGIQLLVFCPSKIDAEDFVSKFPNDQDYREIDFKVQPNSPRKVHVSSEDDRHYNILVQSKHALKRLQAEESASALLGACARPGALEVYPEESADALDMYSRPSTSAAALGSTSPVNRDNILQIQAEVHHSSFEE